VNRHTLAALLACTQQQHLNDLNHNLQWVAIPHLWLDQSNKCHPVVSRMKNLQLENATIADSERKFGTTEAPMTRSYIGMLALASAKLAHVNEAASADPPFSMIIIYISTWALGK